MIIAKYDAILDQWEREDFYDHLNNYAKVRYLTIIPFVLVGYDRHVTDVVAVKIIFHKNSYHRSLKLFVAALASVRAGCVELLAGQF